MHLFIAACATSDVIKVQINKVVAKCPHLLASVERTLPPVKSCLPQVGVLDLTGTSPAMFYLFQVTNERSTVNSILEAMSKGATSVSADAAGRLFRYR